MDAFQKLTRLDPDYPPYVDGLAFSRVNLANGLRTLARDAEGARALDQAIADFAALAEAIPGAPRFRENRAVARTNRAWLLFERGDNAAAREMLDQAIAELNELYRSPDRVPRYLEEMAAAGVVLGQVLADLDQNEAAETNLQSAIAAYAAGLLQQEPTSARYGRGLGAARRHYARLLAGLERREEAQSELALAIEELQEALAGVDEPFARDELALAQEQLGDLLQDMQREDEAQQQYVAARQTRASLPADPQYRYKLAVLLGKFLDEQQQSTALAAASALADEFPHADKFRTLLGRLQFQAADHAACIETITRIDNSTAAFNSPHLFWLALAYYSRGGDGDRDRAEKPWQRRKSECRSTPPAARN